MATRVIKCNCKHEYQDKQYGSGNRVHNPTKKGGTGAIIYRCTACNKETR
jgi:hypothetical protein